MNLPEAVMAALPLSAGRPADRRRRPPADAADRQARLGRRAAPDVPGVPVLRVAVRRSCALRPADDPVRGELPAARRRWPSSCGGRCTATTASPTTPAGRTCCRARPHPDEIRRRRAAPRVPAASWSSTTRREPGAQPLRADAHRADPASAGRSGGLRARPRDGLGVVVPHRAQRAALQEAFPS